MVSSRIEMSKEARRVIFKVSCAFDAAIVG